MAINWNLFPQAFNRQQEEIGQQYDFSFVTPEVVKGFNRYQALRPEEDVKKANKYKEILKNINDEDLKKQWLTGKQREAYENYLMKRRNANLKNIMSEPEPVGATTLAPVVQPEPSKLTDKVKDAEKDLGKALTEIKTLGGSGYSPEPNGLGVLADPYKEKYEGLDFGLDTFRNNLTFDEKSYKSTPQLYDKWDEMTDEQKSVYFTGEPTDEEIESLRNEAIKERLGDDYDSYKRAYGIYGELNPRRQMLEAAKRSSYWDPEIGKIYSSYADKMYEENLKAWEQARKTASENRDYALKMYQATDGMPSYLAEAEYWQKELGNLDKQSPNLTGGWFTGLTDKQVERYGTKVSPSKLSNELWSTIRTGRVAQTDEKGNPLYYSDKTQAMRQMTEDDLKNSEAFKALPPEEQAYWIQQFREKNEKLEQRDLNRTNAVNMHAEKLAPVDFKEWTKLNEGLNKGRLVNFDKEGTAKVAKKDANGKTMKDAKGNTIYENVPAFTENQAIDAMVYLETKGINVDKLFEKNPEFRNLRKEFWGEGEKVSLGNLSKVGLMNFVTALKRDNVLEANIGKIMGLAEREYKKDVRLEKEYGDKIRAKLTNRGIDYSGTQFDTREAETPRTLEEWAKMSETSQSEAMPTQVVDVESFDWSGATYQTEKLKKELKKALNGENSEFKKQADGTYVWVGGTRIQTFNPSTGKITQVRRNPSAGVSRGVVNSGNTSTGVNNNQKNFGQMTREEKRKAVLGKRG